MERLSINETFEKCKEINKTVFIPFVTCGYPELRDTVSILLALQDGGADIIELGIPYSEPQADGPTIQMAHQVALEQNVTLHTVLNTIKEARAKGLVKPVILMGYLNNFLAYGIDKICKDTKEAGGDGFIIVDLPPEEAKSISSSAAENGLSFIPLVATTTSLDRLKLIKSVANGFIYCVSVTGVTGERNSLPEDIGAFMERVRRNIQLPLALGFGLSTREHVVEAGKYADAAVIGSKIVKTIQSAKNDTISRSNAVKEFCLSITQS